ncbi:MAG: hypothetical protein U0736_11690 [Gemmataceae bacterium]
MTSRCTCSRQRWWRSRGVPSRRRSGSPAVPVPAAARTVKIDGNGPRLIQPDVATLGPTNCWPASRSG